MTRAFTLKIAVIKETEHRDIEKEEQRRSTKLHCSLAFIPLLCVCIYFVLSTFFFFFHNNSCHGQAKLHLFQFVILQKCLQARKKNDPNSIHRCILKYSRYLLCDVLANSFLYYKHNLFIYIKCRMVKRQSIIGKQNEYLTFGMLFMETFILPSPATTPPAKQKKSNRKNLINKKNMNLRSSMARE